MPFVDMIRSTRIFVPKSVVKDDGTSVFISKSRENKISRDRCRDHWFRLLEDSGERADDFCYKSKNNVSGEVVREENESVIDFTEETVLSVESVNNCSATTDEKRSKRYGFVYSRKRRKLTGERFVSSSSESETQILEDRMFGIPFVRKRNQLKESKRSFLTELKSRATTSEIKKEPELVEDFDSDIGVLEREVSLNFVKGTSLTFVVEYPCGDICWFPHFLASVLSFMRMSSIRLSLLAAFVSSEPIFRVFSLHGIHFLLDPLSKITWKDNILSFGSCKIFGTNNLVPLFLVDFLAIPFSFMGLHYSIALRSQYLPQCLVRYLKCLLAQTHGTTHSLNGLSFILDGVDIFETKYVAPGSTSLKSRKGSFITDLGELYRKNGLSGDSKNFRNVQRKRNSVRSARVKPLYFLDLYRGISQLDTDLFTGYEGYNSFSAPEHKPKRRKLLSNNPGNNIKELKYSLVELRQNMDSVCCTVNLLVIESDKCYREKGAQVMLECSSPNEWVLTIKKQGLNRYMYKAHEWMKPSTTNRFTHAMIWNGENGWKLEFPDRQDWMIFKELHRECIDRNVRRPPPVNTIPVPSVVQVPDCENNKYVPFVQPDAYITMPADEVTRVSMRKVANYDVDSGDEEWLGKLNNDLDGEHSGVEVVSVEKFEEMIDTLEKAAFYSPNDAFDENKAASLCPDSGRIFGPVYQYWLRKRTQKHSALLRVFQLQPQRKAESQVLNRPVLRKRRSTKRQSQSGRGKQQYLQGLNAEKEQDDIDKVKAQNNAYKENAGRIREDMHGAGEADMKRIEEARKSASLSLELAILKRKHAQTLMDKADLTAYWATIAVRIAEAARVTESAEVATSSFVD